MKPPPNEDGEKPEEREPEEHETAEIPLTQLREWIQIIETADTPTVPYDKEVSVMREKAYEYRGSVLGYLYEKLSTVYYTGLNS